MYIHICVYIHIHFRIHLRTCSFERVTSSIPALLPWPIKSHSCLRGLFCFVQAWVAIFSILVSFSRSLSLSLSLYTHIDMYICIYIYIYTCPHALRVRSHIGRGIKRHTKRRQYRQEYDFVSQGRRAGNDDVPLLNEYVGRK